MNDNNRKIIDLLWEIESKCDCDTIDNAYDYVWKYCDNPEECAPDTGFDFSNAVWGIGEQTIIEYLESLIKRE